MTVTLLMTGVYTEDTLKSLIKTYVIDLFLKFKNTLSAQCLS